MENPTTTSLALVLVWSGKWSPWIHLFLHSCASNPRVDFLIFTDQRPLKNLPANVRMIPMTLADIAHRTGAVLGFAAKIPRAYKLCDYKPLYGLLFPEYLEGYTHWGYCDEDVFWGDIRKFITDELCQAYDIITACRCCVVGQLTILKNIPEVNGLIRSSPHLRTQIQDGGIHLLDERVMNNLARGEERAGRLRVLRRQFQTHDVNSDEWTEWANRLELAENGRVLGPLKYGVARWEDGRLIHEESGEEFAFYHFGSWKRGWAMPRLKPPPRGIRGWRIGPDGLSFILSAGAGKAEEAYVRRYVVGGIFVRMQKRARQQVRWIAELGGRVWRKGRREWGRMVSVSGHPFGRSKPAG